MLHGYIVQLTRLCLVYQDMHIYSIHGEPQLGQPPYSKTTGLH